MIAFPAVVVKVEEREGSVTSYKQITIWNYRNYFVNQNYGNSKHQIPNPKQMPMTEIQNMQNGYQAIDKSPECLGHWTFEFGYCLYFVYCNLGFYCSIREGKSLLSKSGRAGFHVDLKVRPGFFTFDVIFSIMPGH